MLMFLLHFKKINLWIATSVLPFLLFIEQNLLILQHGPQNYDWSKINIKRSRAGSRLNQPQHALQPQVIPINWPRHLRVFWRSPRANLTSAWSLWRGRPDEPTWGNCIFTCFGPCVTLLASSSGWLCLVVVVVVDVNVSRTLVKIRSADVTAASPAVGASRFTSHCLSPNTSSSSAWGSGATRRPPFLRMSCSALNCQRTTLEPCPLTPGAFMRCLRTVWEAIHLVSSSGEK